MPRADTPLLKGLATLRPFGTLYFDLIENALASLFAGEEFLLSQENGFSFRPGKGSVVFSFDGQLISATMHV